MVERAVCSLRPLVAVVWLLAVGLLPSPTAAASLPPTEDQAIAQADTVERAFDLLVDRYVHPLSSAALLDSAWAEVERAAADHHAPAPGAAPALTDDPAADLAAFRTRLTTYLRSGAAFPDDFVAAHAAVAGMAHFVDEPHTYFLAPDQYRQRREWAAGNIIYGGIGVHFTSPGLVVTDVEDGSPAERAGVRPGDRILQVGGESVAELSPLVALDRLRGPVGSVAELVIRARHDGPTRTLAVTREQVHVDTVIGHRIGDVAYIRLRGFPEPSVVDTFNGLLSEFGDPAIRGLIVDLRGNAGGRLDLGTRLLGDFLPAGTPAFDLLDRDGGSQLRVVADEALHWNRPLVVLVDGRTESMGEIFAAALHEQGLATLVGTTTAGSVAGGLLFPLGDGSALGVTAYEITTATGVILNRVGVEPDVHVDGTRATSEHGEDPVLDRALELLVVG
jgi:carboxyl-terminal processing protease